MSGKEIYESKPHPERRLLYRQYSRLFPVPTAWKLALIVSCAGAVTGLAFQLSCFFTNKKNIWFNFIAFFLHSVWAIIYCIYWFGYMKKRYNAFLTWLDETHNKDVSNINN